jgi:hypothetical protein
MVVVVVFASIIVVARGRGKRSADGCVWVWEAATPPAHNKIPIGQKTNLTFVRIAEGGGRTDARSRTTRKPSLLTMKNSFLPSLPSTCRCCHSECLLLTELLKANGSRIYYCLFPSKIRTIDQKSKAIHKEV